jgi:hypothetical protein
MLSLSQYLAHQIVAGTNKKFGRLQADYFKYEKENQMEHPKTDAEIVAALEARIAELEQRVSALELDKAAS